MTPVRSKGSVSPTTQANMYMMIIRSNDTTMLMTRHTELAVVSVHKRQPKDLRRHMHT